jgi:importin-5
LNALFQSTKSPEAAHRESAFRVFAALPTLVDPDHIDVIKNVFLAGLQDQAPQVSKTNIYLTSQVRLSAFKAVSEYFIPAEAAQRSKMNSLVDPLLNVLPPLLTEKNSEDLVEALTALIELATEHPKMFRHAFSHLVQFTISVIKEKDIDDDARQAALELLITFAEGAPVMCRKDEHFTMATVEQILAFMCDHDDSADALEEWRNTDDVRLPMSKLTIVGL